MIDKKEAAKQYKNTVQPMGVYSITNTVNGKVFVGSSLDVNRIFNRIRFQLVLGSYTNSGLQKDFTLHGEAKFAFKVEDYLKPKDDPAYDYKDDLSVLEEMWLEKIKPYGEKGYNTLKEHA